MRLSHSAWILLAALLCAGCSSSEDADVAEQHTPASDALASTLPIVAEFAKSDTGLDGPADPISPFEENLDFFTPPKMIIPIEVDEPEEDLSGELPPLRLVGFVGSSGEKAMVSVKGEMHLVTAGKRLNGVEIVSVKSPNVELRWGETELTMDFYKPTKTDRPQPSTLVSFSPGLSSDKRPNHRGASSGRPKSSPASRPSPSPSPRITLPTLPGLPSAGASSGSGPGLADFPDLGAGPALPAP